ncbi:MAG: hypothetical protein CXR31_03045 [Geobacter sp.]|nr:MAG: hypothetical protein CXR31_03045 [Geobacter sp.]
MDITALGVTVGGVVLMGLTLWFFFGKQGGSRPARDGGLYSCPMHPWITSNDPTAECSICGMKLVRGTQK